MLNRFKKKISEKGQGLTEYVLILAFIAGIAFMMFGGNGSLRGTLVNTFSETVSILGGLFGENDGYVTASQKYPDYFKKYKGENGIVTTEDLKANYTQEERLNADREALALIAAYFLDKTNTGVQDQMKQFSKAYNGCDQWLTDNLSDSRMNAVEDGWSDILVPLSYRGMDYDTEGAYWLESSNNSELIKKMAGSENVVNTGRWNNKSQTKDRIFFSNDMIGSGSSDRAVAMKVHYNDKGVVDKVQIAAQKGTKDQATPTNGITASSGYSAFLGKSGNSESVAGLDITVTGTFDNYKYKVNN